MEGNSLIPEQLIEGFIKGKLSPGEELYLLDWIEKMPENRKSFLELQSRLKKKLINTNDQQINTRWSKFSQKIGYDSTPEKRKAYKLCSFSQIIAVAAAFFVGIVITSVFWQFISNEKPDENIRFVTTPYGAKSNFILPDGSEVWLNSGSTISYPDEFKDKRLVTLSGEAYFEIKKSYKPFIVSTKKGEVEVLGTTFNVNAFDRLTTTLVSGSVKMRNAAKSREIILNPGQQCTVAENGQMNVVGVDSQRYISWKDGSLIFFREPFRHVVREMERWYNVKIELKDPELNELWYTGTLEMESFSEVLELIKITTPIKYNFDRTTRVLTIESVEQ